MHDDFKVTVSYDWNKGTFMTGQILRRKFKDCDDDDEKQWYTFPEMKGSLIAMHRQSSVLYVYEQGIW